MDQIESNFLMLHNYIEEMWREITDAVVGWVNDTYFIILMPLRLPGSSED